MVAVPISQQGKSEPRYSAYGEVSVSANSISTQGSAVKQEAGQDWASWVAAATLVAGGALMVAGHKRAGLAVAATGTALAILEQQEAVETWWKNLPGYLQEAQVFLDKVEGYMSEAAVQGKKIQGMLRR